MLQKMPLIFVSWRQPPQRLHALDQHDVVDEGHQPRLLGHGNEGAGQHHLVGGVAHAGERLVVAALAVGQGHDRLQIKVDAALLDRLAHGVEQPFVGVVPDQVGGDLVRQAGDEHRLLDDEDGFALDLDGLILQRQGLLGRSRLVGFHR